LGKVIQSHKAVVFTDLDDGTAVLLHLDNKFYYSLNETGCFMWKNIDREGGIKEADLVKELVSHFEVSEEEAKSDVHDFIEELKKEGLIAVS